MACETTDESDCYYNDTSYNRYCSCYLNCHATGDIVTIRQKRIWNTVRVPSTLYMGDLNALTVYEKPSVTYNNVNWNQMSDRAEPSIVKRNVPSRGNSTKGSVTRNRPGSMSAPGAGVDVKHGSYARYLDKLKGKRTARTQNNTNLTPLKGNKTKKYGIVRSGSCLCFN